MPVRACKDEGTSRVIRLLGVVIDRILPCAEESGREHCFGEARLKEGAPPMRTP